MAADRRDVSGDQVESMTAEVSRLADEVRVLRDAINDLREELQYAVRNNKPLPPPLHITSMPLDPTTPDFHQRVNAVPTEQIKAMRRSLADESPSPVQQRELF